MSLDLGFMMTRLWRSSLAPQTGDPTEGGARERFRNVFLKFRDRAATLTGEIARDMPEFTVHDITHLDALWEMADKIAGEHISLTPAEAFVLGGAFLVHDAGMGLAAYPEGREGLRRDRSWGDILTANYKRQLGRAPIDEELHNPNKDIEIETFVELLRLRHAHQADKLASISWKSPDDRETYHLIEDLELRKGYGTVIGQIAYSHWWDIDQVRENFGNLPLLSPPATIGCPNDWTVDRLKLACLLRTADAIHLDARRAPGYLRALRKPSGYAALHWTFQEHIHKPSIDGDRLVFTSGQAFKIDEADAWWVGYELLQNADRELRQTETLLQDLKCDYHLSARSVARVESPARLVLNIPTEDWLPVDARIRVSNVAALVRDLGGEHLYGRDQTVPLRELIQNSSDAVRARRLLQNKAESWGNIVVRIGEDENGHWVEVEDNGVGMSTTVLTGPFLDFGRSFWETAMMRQELPGLQGKGFQSTGRYGIGFFSVFMWGERVKVTTQQYRDAQRDTQVLEFKGGLEARPLLRKAQEAEHLEGGGGTRVRVWLKHPPESLFSDWFRTFEKFCVWLCPALDANLYVERAGGQPTKVITASDWKVMDGEALCRRLWVHYENRYKGDGDEYFLHQVEAAEHYRLLRDS
jgi:Histidine kinase-, DNA gyrase B-, and HSP90-like ATPase